MCVCVCGCTERDAGGMELVCGSFAVYLAWDAATYVLCMLCAFTEHVQSIRAVPVPPYVLLCVHIGSQVCIFTMDPMGQKERKRRQGHS